MSHFIPSSEGQFSAWINNFTTTVEADPAAYGLTADDVSLLKAHTSDWDARYADVVAKRDAASAAVAAKKLSRGSLEDVVRAFSKQIQANPGVSKELRRDAGLPIHKTSRTRTPVPNTAPLLRLEASELLAQVISWTDSRTPTRRSRPNCVAACQLYVAVSDVVPSSPKDYRFVVQATKAPTRVHFESDDGGKTAHYLARWINTRGESGPWGSVISSTVSKV